MVSTHRTLDWLRSRLRSGLVIPAHPLALTSARKLDERRQRALTRYDHAARAGASPSRSTPHSSPSETPSKPCSNLFSN